MASGKNQYFINKIKKLKEENQEELDFKKSTEKPDSFLAGKH